MKGAFQTNKMLTFKDIKNKFISLEDLPYYNALSKREFNIEDTMRAQLQDLGRALGCQGLRDIQISKLTNAFNQNIINVNDYKVLLATIKDEDASHNRQSHLDMRLQIFEGICPKDILLNVNPLPQVKRANNCFRDIFNRSLLEITAAVGAIERWYFPVAEFLEEQYLKRGYTSRQVYTYTIHKVADIEHSSVALDFVFRNVKNNKEKQKVIKAVEDAFKTTKIYDEARYIAAKDKQRTFESYLK